MLLQIQARQTTPKSHEKQTKISRRRRKALTDRPTPTTRGTTTVVRSTHIVTITARSAPTLEDMTHAPRSLESTRVEIVLLAAGVLVLVCILGIVLLLGAGARSRRHRVDSETCAPHRDAQPWHDESSNGTSSEYTDDQVGFVDSVRRRSASLAGDLKKELEEMKKMTVAGSPADFQTVWKEVEDGCARGLRKLSDDLSARLRRDSHHDVRHENDELLINVTETSTASARESGHPYARRRSSKAGPDPLRIDKSDTERPEEQV